MFLTSIKVMGEEQVVFFDAVLEKEPVYLVSAG
jgi:hypothetical protein